MSVWSVAEGCSVVGVCAVVEVYAIAAACPIGGARAVGDAGGIRLQHEQPARRSLGERSLGNQLGRQVIGEVMALHAAHVIGIVGPVLPGCASELTRQRGAERDFPPEDAR